MNQLDQTLATGYSISPALGEYLDHLQGHDDDEGVSDCPVVREAQRLSSFLLCAGDEANARSIDGNPWNGVNHEGLRADALYLVQQIDRYLAARKERFGVEAAQWVFRKRSSWPSGRSSRTPTKSERGAPAGRGGDRQLSLIGHHGTRKAHDASLT